MSKRVVLTVSGFIAADIHEHIANGRRPRADYLELARGFDSDILDYAAARETTGWIGRILSWIGGPNLVLAYACKQGCTSWRACTARIQGCPRYPSRLHWNTPTMSMA